MKLWNDCICEQMVFNTGGTEIWECVGIQC